MAIVEHNLHHLVRHAVRVYALHLGPVVDEVPAGELQADTERRRKIFVEAVRAAPESARAGALHERYRTVMDALS